MFNLKEIIEILPSIVLYVVPGYLFLWVYRFRLSLEIDKDEYLLLKSIVISYLIIFPIDSIGELCNCISSNSNLGKIVIILIAIGAGYVFSCVVVSDLFKKLLKKLKIYRSVYSNIWNDVIDDVHGLWIKAYMPEEKLIYKGDIVRYEEKKDTENTYLVLSNYTLLNYDGKVIVSRENEDNSCVMINSRNVSRIELEYHPDSKCIPKLTLKKRLKEND